MRPLLAAALVATSAGIVSAGPIVANTSKADASGTELIATSLADTRHGITLQKSTFGELSHSLITPLGGLSVVWPVPADNLLADSSYTPLIPWESRGLLLCVASTERAYPFSGNPGIEPRPTDDPPLSEPIELLWLVAFGSLIVGGIVAVQRRFSTRSGEERRERVRLVRG